jgi:hypothetical protein
VKIAILGRGVSLNNFIDIPDVDLYVIVNEFENEIKQNIHLKNKLTHTPVIHVANRNILTVIGMIQNNFYDELNIIKHVQPYIAEMKCNHGSCYCNRFHNGFFYYDNNKKIPTELLDDIHKQYMFKSGDIEHPGNKYPYYYPSTGLAAISYTVINYNPSDVYLIGFDFHEGGYAYGGDMNAPLTERNGQKETLSKLINEFENTSFHLYTLAEFPYEHKNLISYDIIKQERPMIKNKKLAVVLGGWHYPYLYYKQLKEQKIPTGWEVDFYVVSHRDPELPIVFEEKQKLLENRSSGLLQDMDENLYNRIITKEELKELGFTYNEEQSAIGDLYQLNQWVHRHYKGQYDKVLFTHDDNYLLNDELFVDILEHKAQIFLNTEENKIEQVDSKFDWKHLSSGVLENTTVPRTSFTFIDKEMLDEIKDDLEEISTKGVDLDRTGQTDTLYDVEGQQVSTKALYSWNAPSRNFTNWMRDRGYDKKSVRLSPVYRVTKYFIEGERGFMWTQRDESRIINNLSKYYDLS